MTDLKVVEFTGCNIRDIPRLARQFANDVEAGIYGDVEAVALAIETDEGFQVLGWANADAMRSIGLFSTGAAIISAAQLED